MSSQTITALYETHASYTVPAGIDLNDTKTVCWYIRWNTLYIDTKDGRHFEIEGDEYGLKCPEEVYDDDDNKIDFNGSFDSSSEEEESDEEKEEDDD